jgi:hypothetical protein
VKAFFCLGFFFVKCPNVLWRAAGMKARSVLQVIPQDVTRSVILIRSEGLL